MLYDKDNYRWIVLCGVFIAYLISDGWSYSLAIFYPEILIYFEESRGTTALIPALMYGLPMLFSPFICIIIPVLGCRLIGIVGGATLALSLVLASFTTSFWVLCTIMSIMSTIALAAIYDTAIVSITFHFKEDERGFATGLALTGSGIGSILFPHLIEYLLYQFSLRSSLFIIGGVLSNAIISGVSYTPPRLNVLKRLHDIPLESNKNSNIPMIFENPESISEITISQANKKESKARIFKNTLLETVHLFKSIPLLIFLIANFLLYLCMSIPFTYVVDQAFNLGYDATYASILLSLIGLFRIIGQILIGFLNDRNIMPSSFLFGLLIIIQSLAIACIPLCTIYVTLCLCYCIFGLCISVTYVLTFICLIEISGENHSILAFGIIQFVQGIATIIGTPFGGFLFDLNDNYNISFYISGGVMFISGILICIIYKINHRFTKQNIVTTH